MWQDDDGRHMTEFRNMDDEKLSIAWVGGG